MKGSGIVQDGVAGQDGCEITAMDAMALSQAIHARSVGCVEVMTAYGSPPIEWVHP